MEKVTDSQKAYLIIKNDLMEGKIDDYINGRKMADQLGLGYSPVREALFHLEREGLIHKIQNSGYFVNQIDWRDVGKLFQVRECVELFVWNQMFLVLGEAEIKQMKHLHEQEKEAIRQKDFKTCWNVDIEFHSVCLRAYGNRDLLNLYLNNREKQMICVKNNLLLYDEESVREHGSFLEMVEEGNKEAALQELQKHILNYRKRMQLWIQGEKGLYEG